MDLPLVGLREHPAGIGWLSVRQAARHQHPAGGSMFSLSALPSFVSPPDAAPASGKMPIAILKVTSSMLVTFEVVRVFGLHQNEWMKWRWTREGAFWLEKRGEKNKH